MKTLRGSIYVAAAVLTLMNATPSAAITPEEFLEEWLPASGGKFKSGTPYQWAVNTSTGKMRLCVIAGPELLRCFSEPVKEKR